MSAASTVDYRVSRLIVLCKDCGDDVGLYPSRHKCRVVKAPPMPTLVVKGEQASGGYGTYWEMFKNTLWKTEDGASGDADTESPGGALWNRVVDAGTTVARAVGVVGDDESDSDVDDNGETKVTRALKEYHLRTYQEIPDFLLPRDERRGRGGRRDPPRRSDPQASYSDRRSAYSDRNRSRSRGRYDAYEDEEERRPPPPRGGGSRMRAVRSFEDRPSARMDNDDYEQDPRTMRRQPPQQPMGRRPPPPRQEMPPPRRLASAAPPPPRTYASRQPAAPRDDYGGQPQQALPSRMAARAPSPSRRMQAPQPQQQRRRPDAVMAPQRQQPSRVRPAARSYEELPRMRGGEDYPPPPQRAMPRGASRFR